jgi:hypothetical protein
MKLPKLYRFVFSLTFASTLFFTTVPAFGATLTYTFNENCDGVSSAGGAMNCQIWKDPTSGMNTIRYDLPASLVGGLTGGDLRVLESTALGDFSDVLRFDPNLHSVFVFSDNDTDPGEGALADVGLPVSIPGTQDFERELSPGIFGYSYTPPDANSPGFIAGGVTYTFISDEVPEPSTFLVMALPLAVMLLRRRTSRVRATN